MDSELGRLRGQAEEADQQAGVLTEELSAVAGRVRELQAGVDAQQARLAVLESTLASAQARLATLDRTITRQTARLERLRGEYRVALARLERRVRQLYMTDEPDVLSFVLGTSSFTDIIDNLELLGRIGRQDERIAAGVKHARDGVAEARRQTRVAREEQARVEAAAASAASEQRGVVTRLVASRDALVAARQDKSETLASIQEDRESVLAEIDALEEQSAALAAQIRQAQQQAAASSAPSIVPPSGSGVLGWPVSGPVVSGFGMRSGRMHEGIDITCPTGTPVRAAAAGTVIHAGWLGGYGNLVVVDHGGGPLDRVRAQLVLRVVGRSAGRSGPGHLVRREHGRLERPARPLRGPRRRKRRGPPRLPVGTFGYAESARFGSDSPGTSRVSGKCPYAA